MARNTTAAERRERKRYHKHRDWAFTLGLLIGVGILVAVAIGMLALTNQSGDSLTGFLVIGGGTLLIGIGLWWYAQRLDEENYMIQKATPMPLPLVNAHDNVWIEGQLRVPHPAIAPYFGLPCAYYHYKLEERRTRTVRRGNRTTTESYWVTLQNEKRYARTFAVEDGAEVEIDVPAARIDYPTTSATRIGRHRHTLTYLPWKGKVSACGVLEPNPRERVPADIAGDGMHEAREQVHERQLSRYAQQGSGTRAGVLGLFDVLFGAPRGLRLLGSWTARQQRHREQPERQQRIASRVNRKAAGQPRDARRLRRTRPDDARLAVVVDEDATPSPVAGEAPEPPPVLRTDVPATRTPLLLKNVGNIPLIVTPLPRDEWVDRTEAKETRYGVASVVVLWGSLTALFAAAAHMLGSLAIGFNLAIGGVLAVIVLAPICAISLYNRLVGYRTRVASAWAQIDVLLSMRRELIPNLVATIEGSVSHERALLERIARLRAGSLDATARTGSEAMRVENAIGGLSRELTVVAEAYPALKTDEVYRRLMRELTAVEEKIAWSRSFYNENVREYNIMIEALPNSLLAGPCGFRALPYWRDES